MVKLCGMVVDEAGLWFLTVRWMKWYDEAIFGVEKCVAEG
jgi:hypothetical protein